MEQYIEFARKALKIVRAQYSRGDDLGNLVLRLRNVIVLPATQAEFNIQQLCLEIAKAIDAQGNYTQLQTLLDQLETEAIINFFD